MCTGRNDPCENTDEPLILGVCDKREQCYRYTAKPCEYRQSFFAVAPFTQNASEKQKCLYFWDNAEHEASKDV
jgi:hypothetical protein